MNNKLQKRTLVENPDLKFNVDKKSLHYKFMNDKAQTTALELTVVVVCIIFALIAMQGYLKRTIEGRLRSSADEIGSQYQPGNTFIDFTTSSRSSIFTNAVVEEAADGNLSTTTTVTTNYDEQTTIGTETVGAY